MAWSFRQLVPLLFAAGLTLGFACTGPLPMTTDGSDSDEECPVGSLNCSCTMGASCDPGLICASSKCVTPNASDTEVPEPTTTGTDMTTGVDSTTGDFECNPSGTGAIDPGCPESSPYCLAGECVRCEAIECDVVSPTLPVCDPNTGRCAACACDDANPVCDPETHTCSKCSEQSQCPDSGCDLWTGACLPVSSTVWVREFECNDASAGGSDVPLCTINEAIQRVAGSPGAYAVRVHPGEYTLSDTLQVPSDRLVALVHATGNLDAAVTIHGTPVEAIKVEENASLLIDGLRFADLDGDMVNCASGRVWLEQVRVHDGAGTALVGNNCTAKVRRSVFSGNLGGYAVLEAGLMELENSFITQNGSFEDSPHGGVSVTGGGTIHVVYSTFVDNRAFAGTALAIACDEVPPKELITLRNSVAINQGFATVCSDGTISNSAFSSKTPGATNHGVDAFADLSQYLAADPALTGVYRAVEGSALAGLAVWKDGDPPIDFEGDARPDQSNLPDYAGADRIAN